MQVNQINTTKEQVALSLFELNNLIKKVISNSFDNAYWIRAEMSDVRINASSGHCYLEFIEKDAMTGQIVAKARGSIWAKTFRLLKPYFEQETGQSFGSGIKVLVKVTVEFHELYGFSLNVLDIDPSFTLGDMMRKRLEIIRKLKEEGVFSLNKELDLPTLPQRIALITSPTAAGYEDFMHQLMTNRGGYPFYVKLFPALMQGEKTEASVIESLDRIYPVMELFDVVVIIRGGGATSDLNCFDSYMLAANCAQFPLPVITGIGHERDDTVVDLVAHTRLKTPTAVAEFLINRMDEAAFAVDDAEQRIIKQTSTCLQQQKSLLQILGNRLPAAAIGRVERNRILLSRMEVTLPVLSQSLLKEQLGSIDLLKNKLSLKIDYFLDQKRKGLQLDEQFIRMASPDYILQRGYSITRCNGKIVKRRDLLKVGDQLTTQFMDGEIKSVISE